ncbi:MAG: hypothetical protein JNG82_08175 [Opitutaceae bacterium]|jgi:hypothetical protein|nr:hypothetical protein [Opitutaceae bacterium]
MATEPPDGLTRPPDEHDLVALARELNRLGARYVVIGGVAMNRLGFIRATEDLDLLIARDRENQALVRRALEILPDKAVRELGPEEDLSTWVVVRVNDVITVDLMTEASGIGYAEAETGIEWVELTGVKVPFASAELMLRFKQSLREKDVMDRQFLENQKKP